MEKHYYIVAPMDVYLDYVRENNLNPTETFQCDSLERANRDVTASRENGIHAEVVVVSDN